jgi:hypothetical protein
MKHNSIPSSLNKSTIELQKPIGTTSSHTCTKPNVVCSAFSQNELLTIYDANNIFRDVIAKYNLDKSLNEMRNQGYFVNTDI